MNVIIIDDLIHVVKGIVTGVNWEALKVTNVFEANNSIEARKIFENYEIDIMVSDIEMPMGNGLQLLEWVREHYPKTECIFLTSHGEFEYAKAALKLNSFDYLLQPIKYEELEKVIARAMEKIKKNVIKETYYSYGVYWKVNEVSILEKFWHDVLSGIYKDDLKKIVNAASTIGIKLNTNQRYLPTLITVIRRDVVMKDWDDVLLKYALTNILSEILTDYTNNVVLIQLNSGNFVYLINEEVISTIELSEKYRTFVEASHINLNCSIACYMGELVEISEISQMMQRLGEYDRNNVTGHSKVFRMDIGQEKSSVSIEIKDLKRWETLLVQGNNEKVIDEITSFLNQLSQENEIDATSLLKFHHEFIQMFNRVAQERQLDTERLFKEETIAQLYLKSMTSVHDMLEFVKLSLAVRFDEVNVEKYYQSSIDTIKVYIDENLEKELSRNDLADKVFLNPDYLSRLFKKETGISLIEYIINKRTSLSKELLVKTDMSVSIIASKVGYSNFSHFSKVFKKITGVTPIEYRQKNR